jgi:hypothetical protein
VCTTLAALSLAAASAGFSITGMTSIFVGAFWPVIGIGIALELGKLSAVAWLGRAGCAVHPARPLKIAVGMLIGVSMALNAIGAYAREMDGNEINVTVCRIMAPRRTCARGKLSRRTSRNSPQRPAGSRVS